MIQEKSALRKKYRQIRNSISEEKRKIENEAIARILLDSDKYRSANSIFLYISFGSEVDTLAIAQRILSDGKGLAVPLCDTNTHEMSAVRISSLDMLKSGAYGIPEPPRDSAEMVSKDNIDLAVVPALAFDRNRMRLGYGGGYYDKFLRDFKGYSVGIAFSECIADTLPVESFDRAVDIVICPEEMI